MTPDEALSIVDTKAAGRLGDAMTIEEAMGIAAEMEAIGTQIDLLSNGHALVTLAAEVRRLRGVVVALCDDAVEHLKAEYPYRRQYPSEMRHYITGLDEINEYLRSVGAQTKCQKP